MVRAIQFQNKRVGSTFLQNAINSHPDIAGIDEVFVNMARKPGMKKSGFVPFLRSNARTPMEYIENIIYKKYPNKHTIFKLMYNQIDYHDGLFDYIIRNKVPIIHLMRRNLVKQVISGLTAARTDHYPVVISPERLFMMVKDANHDNQSFKERLKDNIKLVLYYEDIIGETLNGRTYLSSNANIAVCNFFGVDQLQLFSTTTKKNKKELSVYLPNIDEIDKRFKGTEFSWMIKEKNI